MCQYSLQFDININVYSSYINIRVLMKFQIKILYKLLPLTTCIRCMNIP